MKETFFFISCCYILVLIVDYWYQLTLFYYCFVFTYIIRIISSFSAGISFLYYFFTTKTFHIIPSKRITKTAK